MKAFQFGDSRNTILRAEHLSETYMEYYRSMTDLEKLEGTQAMLDVDIQARKVSESITRYFNIHLIDEFKLDYDKLTYIFSNLAEQWKRVCCNQEKIKMPALSEAQRYLKGALTFIVENLNYVNGLIYDSLKSISNNFATVEDRFCSYTDDISLMKAVHDKRYNDFLASDYLKDRQQTFINAVSAHVMVNGSSCESYQVYCNSIMSCGNTLFNIYIEGGDVCSYMVEHKNEIEGSDVNSYFLHRYMYEELQKRILRFEYEEPCDARYKGMFRNRAAQELAKVLLQIFYKYIDKLKGTRYGVVMLAFMDMKIIEPDTFCSLFKDFINNEVLKPNGENLIVDAKTITDLTKKVKNSPFKRLTNEDLLDSDFTKTEFNRLSDTYWQCISIINLIFEEDLASKGFALYLCKTHENTPDVSVFGDFMKLKTIFSVFRGFKPLI